MPEYVVATTLEVPWNTADSTWENYQAVGRRLGLTIERFLNRENSDKGSANTEIR